MRQVARRAGVQRGQEQERAGLLRRDQFSREFAGEVKAGIDIDRTHLRPGLLADRESVIGLAPRRRGAVNEMRHLANRRPCLRQQRIAHGGIGEVADEGHGQFRPRRGFDRRRDRVPVHVGEHGAHALADQGLRDRAPDAIARTCDQRRLARGIE